jgi:hypothetical protein
VTNIEVKLVGSSLPAASKMRWSPYMLAFGKARHLPNPSFSFESQGVTFACLRRTFASQCIKIAIFRVELPENVKISLSPTFIAFHLDSDHQLRFKDGAERQACEKPQPVVAK